MKVSLLRSLRRGITMIEVMVVIGILAVLVAILIPAVQKVREHAAYIQCQTNLKQIGLAMHSYHDVYRQLPPGQYSLMGGADPNPIPKPYYRYGCWFQPILPYIEQGAILEQIDSWIASHPATAGTYPNNGVYNADGHERQMPIFMCPSDPSAGKNRTYSSTDPNSPPAADELTSQGFHGNYVVNCGDNFLNPEQNPANGNLYDGTTSNGVFYVGSKTKLTDIVDGTSTTMMASEILLTPDSATEDDTRGRYFKTYWGESMFTAKYRPNQSSDVIGANGCVTNEWAPCTEAAVTNSGSAIMTPRSFHRPGVNVIMCDGSARFVRNDVNLTSWRGVATRHGNDSSDFNYEAPPFVVIDTPPPVSNPDTQTGLHIRGINSNRQNEGTVTLNYNRASVYPGNLYGFPPGGPNKGDGANYNFPSYNSVDMGGTTGAGAATKPVRFAGVDGPSAAPTAVLPLLTTVPQTTGNLAANGVHRATYPRLQGANGGLPLLASNAQKRQLVTGYAPLITPSSVTTSGTAVVTPTKFFPQTAFGTPTLFASKTPTGSLKGSVSVVSTLKSGATVSSFKRTWVCAANVITRNASTVGIDQAPFDQLTVNGHGWADDTIVTCVAAASNVQLNQTYYVKVVNGNTVQLSTTPVASPTYVDIKTEPNGTAPVFECHLIQITGHTYVDNDVVYPSTTGLGLTQGAPYVVKKAGTNFLQLYNGSISPANLVKLSAGTPGPFDGRIQVTGHGLSDNSAVAFSAVSGGLTINTTYFVKALDANWLQLYPTSGPSGTVPTFTGQPTIYPATCFLTGHGFGASTIVVATGGSSGLADGSTAFTKNINTDMFQLVTTSGGSTPIATLASTTGAPSFYSNLVTNTLMAGAAVTGGKTVGPTTAVSAAKNLTNAVYNGTDTLTFTAHGWVDDTIVKCTALGTNLALTLNQFYYVKVVTANTIKLSTTSFSGPYITFNNAVATGGTTTLNASLYTFAGHGLANDDPLRLSATLNGLAAIPTTYFARVPSGSTSTFQVFTGSTATISNLFTNTGTTNGSFNIAMVKVAGHGLSDTHRVAFSASVGGITANTPYFVKNVNANWIELYNNVSLALGNKLAGFTSSPTIIPSTCALTAHALATKDAVTVSLAGGSGLTVGNTYYVKNVHADLFQLCTDTNATIPIASGFNTTAGAPAFGSGVGGGVVRIVGHGFNDGDPFVASTTAGGLTPKTCYFVKKIDNDNFSLFKDEGLSIAQPLSATPGPCNVNGVLKTAAAHGMATNDPLYHTSGYGGLAANTFYKAVVHGTKVFQVADTNGALVTVSASSPNAFNQNGVVFAANHGLNNQDLLVASTVGGGLTPGNSYFMKKLDNDMFQVFSDYSLLTPVALSGQPGAFNISANSTINFLTAHNLVDGSPYVPISTANGMTAYTKYFAKRLSSTQIAVFQNYSLGVFSNPVALTAGTPVPANGLITVGAGHGYATSPSPPPVQTIYPQATLGGLSQATAYYVRPVDANLLQVFSDSGTTVPIALSAQPANFNGVVTLPTGHGLTTGSAFNVAANWGGLSMGTTYYARTTNNGTIVQIYVDTGATTTPVPTMIDDPTSVQVNGVSHYLLFTGNHGLSDQDPVVPSEDSRSQKVSGVDTAVPVSGGLIKGKVYWAKTIAGDTKGVLLFNDPGLTIPTTDFNGTAQCTCFFNGLLNFTAPHGLNDGDVLSCSKSIGGFTSGVAKYAAKVNEGGSPSTTLVQVFDNWPGTLNLPTPTNVNAPIANTAFNGFVSFAAPHGIFNTSIVIPTVTTGGLTAYTPYIALAPDAQKLQFVDVVSNTQVPITTPWSSPPGGEPYFKGCLYFGTLKTGVTAAGASFNAGTDVFTVTAGGPHGWSDGEIVKCTTSPGASTTPALVVNSYYYIGATTATTFKLSTTPITSPTWVDITGTAGSLVLTGPAPHTFADASLIALQANVQGLYTGQLVNTKSWPTGNPATDRFVVPYKDSSLTQIQPVGGGARVDDFNVATFNAANAAIMTTTQNPHPFVSLDGSQWSASANVAALPSLPSGKSFFLKSLSNNQLKFFNTVADYSGDVNPVLLTANSYATTQWCRTHFTYTHDFTFSYDASNFKLLATYERGDRFGGASRFNSIYLSKNDYPVNNFGANASIPFPTFTSANQTIKLILRDSSVASCNALVRIKDVTLTPLGGSQQFVFNPATNDPIFELVPADNGYHDWFISGFAGLSNGFSITFTLERQWDTTNASNPSMGSSTIDFWLY